MASVRKFYKEYKNNSQINTREFHNNLARFLEKVFSRKPNLPVKLFDDSLTTKIYQPDDYCRNADSQKEIIYRAIYSFLQRNKLRDSGLCLVHLIENYNPNFCFVWRAGFHIFRNIGKEDELRRFFDSIMAVRVPDHENMIYEYFLELLSRGQYQQIRDIYDHLPEYGDTHNQFVTKRENALLKTLIKLTVAVACYCIWKTSILSEGNEKEDIIAGDQAEIYFRDLRDLIDEGEMIDNYITCYIDLLEHRLRFTEALDILKMYYDKCNDNFNAVRYLLRFVMRNECRMNEVAITHLPRLRLEYVMKMMPIDPRGDPFTLSIVRQSVNDMMRAGETKLLTVVLFELLENSQWSMVPWPWELLCHCIQVMGVNSATVKDRWSQRRHWRQLYLDNPRNVHMERLAQLMQ